MYIKPVLIYTVFLLQLIKHINGKTIIYIKACEEIHFKKPTAYNIKNSNINVFLIYYIYMSFKIIIIVDALIMLITESVIFSVCSFSNTHTILWMNHLWTKYMIYSWVKYLVNN